MATPEAHRAQVDLAKALLGLHIDEDRSSQPSDSHANDADNSNATYPVIDIDSRTVAPTSEHHELYLEFPALALLHPNTEPHLEPPRDVPYREQPKMDFCKVSDQYALTYATRIGTINDVKSAAIPEFRVFGTSADALVDSVERLSHTPGVSKLEVVAWGANGHVTYHARLTTRWITATLETTEISTFQLGDRSWMSTLEQRDDEGWADLLLDLLERASDRAYFHVQQHLRAHNSDLAHSEDARWTQHWNTAKLRTPNQILIDNLQFLSGQSYASSALFPCGHVSHGNEFYILHHTSEVEAAELRCKICDKYALSDTQYHRVKAWWDRCQRAKFFLDEQCWAGLERKISNPESSFQVTHDDLCFAIDDVLSTFETPESIDPFELCPTKNDESAILVLHFHSLLHGGSETLTVSLEDGTTTFFENALNKLRGHYKLEPQDNLEAVLPVGYAHFLRRWMRRVFVIVATRAQEKENELVESLMEMMMSSKEDDDDEFSAVERSRRNGKMKA